MGKTILELFQSKQLPQESGKTAQQAYDIHNSKAHRNESQSPLINLVGFPAQQALRNAVSSRTSETRLEEELSGIQPLTMVSTPFLYGTDIIRLKTKTTSEKDDMVNDVNTSGGSNGLIGGALKSLASGVNSLLGMPVDIIPTRLKLDSKFKNANAWEYTTVLPQVKKDAAGSIIGQFLKKNGVSGNPSQIAQAALGGLINTATSAVSGLIMGTPKTVVLPYPTLKGNYITTIGQPDDGGGSMFLMAGLPVTYPFYGSGGDPGAYAIQHLHYGDPSSGGANYSITISKDNLATADRNDLSTLMQVYGKSILPNDIDPERILKTRRYSSTVSTDDYGGKSDESYGKWFIDKSDNSSYMIETYQRTSTIMGKQNKQFDKTKGDEWEYDFIDLIFKSVFTGKFIQFAATVTGLSETFSPGWDSAQFIGSPYKYYTYGSIERSVTFDFKVFARNEREHMNNWDRLQVLANMVYPQGVTNAGSIQPPILQLTLGTLYYYSYGFIENLSYTIDDNTPWELGLPYSEAENYTGDIDQYSNDLVNYVTPKIITVAVTFKLLQSAATSNVYPFPNRKAAPPPAPAAATPAYDKNSLPSAGAGGTTGATPALATRTGTFAQPAELIRPFGPESGEDFGLPNPSAVRAPSPSLMNPNLPSVPSSQLANMDRTVTVTTTQTGLPVQSPLTLPKPK